MKSQSQSFAQSDSNLEQTLWNRRNPIRQHYRGCNRCDLADQTSKKQQETPIWESTRVESREGGYDSMAKANRRKKRAEERYESDEQRKVSRTHAHQAEESVATGEKGGQGGPDSRGDTVRIWSRFKGKPAVGGHQQVKKLEKKKIPDRASRRKVQILGRQPVTLKREDGIGKNRRSRSRSLSWPNLKRNPQGRVNAKRSACEGR